MSSNPYQPPTNEKQSFPKVDGPIRFAGGWLAVIGIGLLGGLFAAATFFGFTFATASGWTIVVAWLVASYVLVSMQKGIHRPIVQRCLLTLAAATVGFFLFVFTCSVSSAVAGFGIYGGPIAIPIVASIISFVLVMLLIAKVIHDDAIRKQRKRYEDAIEDDLYKDATE